MSKMQQHRSLQSTSSQQSIQSNNTNRPPAHQQSPRSVTTLAAQNSLNASQHTAQLQRKSSEIVQVPKKETPHPIQSIAPTNLPHQTTDSSQEQTVSKELPKALIKQSYITAGKHQVCFQYKANRWRAEVNEHLPIGFTRRLSLPVYCEPGFKVEELANRGSAWHKRHLHICFPEQDQHHRGYAYIGSVGLKGGGAIQLDIENIINTMIAGYRFINPAALVPDDMITGWRNFLQEIANTLANTDIKLNVPMVTADTDLKNSLEEIIERHTQRRMQLGSYAAAYNHVVNQVKEQIKQKQGLAIDPSAYPADSYQIAFQFKLFNMMPLVAELNKVFAVEPGATTTFDLGNLLHIADVVVSFKESFYSFEKEVREQREAAERHKEQQIHVQQEAEQRRREEEMQRQRENIGEKEVKRETKEEPKNYDFPGGMNIPHTITLDNGNSISVTFGVTEDGVFADNKVNKKLIPALIQVLNTASKSVDFHTIHISATTNGEHGKKSNHSVRKARAIDISMIDGKYVESLGPKDPLVIAFQNAMDELPDIRENFGPFFRHKFRRRYSSDRLREQHKDHIHFSINE